MLLLPYDILHLVCFADKKKTYPQVQISQIHFSSFLGTGFTFLITAADPFLSFILPFSLSFIAVCDDGGLGGVPRCAASFRLK